MKFSAQHKKGLACVDVSCAQVAIFEPIERIERLSYYGLRFFSCSLNVSKHKAVLAEVLDRLGTARRRKSRIKASD